MNLYLITTGDYDETRRFIVKADSPQDARNRFRTWVINDLDGDDLHLINNITATPIDDLPIVEI